MRGEIDLYYGDETQISEEGYIPYGWQCKDENIAIESAKGIHISCFGILARDNRLIYKTSVETINSDFVIEQLDYFSFTIKKHTVIVLDNASIHQSRKMKKMQEIWAKRNLFIFFLPPYSPHLNIIERLWKELKTRWICPENYKEGQSLFYAVTLILNEVGRRLKINFKPMNFNLT